MPQTLFQSFNQTEGLNLGVSPYLNKPGECREALNCDFNEVGALVRHPGYQTYGTGLDASNVLGLYDFKTVAGATKWLAKTGTTLYYDNSGTWTSAQTGLTSGEDVTFATHLDTLIVGSASDAPKKSTNGTSFSSLGGSPPTAKFWLTFDNKLYALNLGGSLTSRMRWSDDGTIETWTATNIQDVATNIGVGDQITGGTVNNNSLLVFKNYSTWKWDTIDLKVIHATAGCRASKSIATIDDWSFWLSHKGIMATNGGKPFRISNPVKPFIDEIPDVTTPVGWADDNFYYLYIGTVVVFGQSITNCVLIYDYDHNVWSYKTLNDAVTTAAILTNISNTRSAYFGNSGGQVYKFKTGNSDNNQPIPFKWVGAPLMSGYAHLRKNYQYLYVFLDRTAKIGIDVLYSLDFGDFKPLGLAQDAVTEFTFPMGSKGHNIRLAFESNLTTDQQKILGYLCLGEIEPGRMKSII